MAQKTVLIIGAGIAGLAAGCYAQMNGWRSIIFELHDLPGGLCTAWERKGYTFDGCIHYLFGSAPNHPYHQLWRELGAVQDRPIINHSEFMQVIDGEGRRLIAYCDPDQLEDHLLTLAPQDAKAICMLCQGVRDFMAFDMSVLQMTPRRLMGPAEGMVMANKMLPFVPVLARWGLHDATSFSQRFSDPLLRAAFPHLFAWETIPMMAALSLLAYMRQGNAGFPQGGSLEFARAIERRYLELGGEIHYKAQVERILTRDGRAVGVRLYDNREAAGDAVISAADTRATLYDMLPGTPIPRVLRRCYEGGQLPIRPQVQISLGIDQDLSSEPHWATYLLREPLAVCGEPRTTLGIKHYCFDPSLAPAGRSAVEVMLPSTYRYWQRIYGRRLYDSEQVQEAQPVIDFLDARYPGLRDKIEVVDVATPLSYERYTGNWQGSTCGWLLTRRTMWLMLRGLPKQLPALRNFYLAGQWVEPGGSVPLAAMSGRSAVQLLCAEAGQRFHVPSEPATVRQLAPA